MLNPVMLDLMIINPWLQWWTGSVPPIHQGTFARLLLALILGAGIGMERQWRQRAAGLRTNTLVCFGAAAFVDLGAAVAPGSTQIIAYVVSGVGFLGAGAIMKDGGSVRGLNTAATLWCSAAVGACAGAGELLDAVFVTVLLLLINVALRPLARFIDRRSLANLDTRVLYRLRLSCDTSHEADAQLQLARAIAERGLTLRELSADKVDDTDNSIVQAIVESGTRDSIMLNKLADELRAFPWTDSIDWTQTESETE